MIKSQTQKERFKEDFKLFVESVNDLICVVKPDSKLGIQFINEQVFKKTLGYIRKEIVEKSLLFLIHPEDKKKFLKFIKKVSEEINLNEIRLKTQNDNYLTFELKAKLFKNYDEKEKILLIFKDISATKNLESRIKESGDNLKRLTSLIPEIRFWKLFNPKKYEEAFRISHDMLQNVIDNIPVSIFWKDTNLIYLGCNRNYADLINAGAPENVMGETDYNLLDDEVKAEALLKHEQHIIESNEAEFHVVEPRTLQNGEIIWLDVNRIPLLDSEGAIVGILVTYEDISERRKAEQKLRESEEKFRRVFQAIPDTYFLVSCDGTVLDYKGKNMEFYLSLANFRGKNIFNIFPKEIETRSANAIKKTIRTQNPCNFEFSLQNEELRRYFEARYLYFSEDRVAIFIREITERKNAELLIEEEFKRLKELEQIRKDLITRFSHELKTPLIPLIGGAELLSTAYKDQLGVEAQEIIELINKGAIRLRELVDKLLELSQIEYNKMILKKEHVNMKKLILDCSESMRFLIEKRQLNLILYLSDDISLTIDKKRMEEVIANLFSNAIKNTPPNGTITIKLERKGDRALIIVEDTGVGLTRKEEEVLFTRFGKIERDCKGLEFLDIQGSGLGLFLTKNIVELHGGEIWAESPGRNKGSTFTIKLPCK